MARKKRKSGASRRSTGRRRSIGKIADKSTLALVAGVAGGAIVTSLAAAKLSSLDPKMKAAVLAAAGVLIAGKSNNQLIKGIGLGVAGAGVTQLARAFNVLPASVAGSPYINFTPTTVSGFNSFPNFPQANTIAGFNSFPNSPQINTIGNLQMAAAGIS